MKAVRIIAILVAVFLPFSPILQPLLAQESGSVRFLGHLIPPQGGSYVAGCWGWTDTLSGREYAILGSNSGTSIVEITDAENPVERDFIPGLSSSWREVQVHENYAYVVTEASGGGTQIIDLSTLPDSAHLVKTFIYTQGGKHTGRVHTNHIRDGYLYLNGCANWSPGGVLIFSLADPENPAFLGEYAGQYFHDSFVRGDTLFGAAIYGGGIDIIDISNKTAPQFLANINYSGSGTHNLATTTDGRYVLSTDEIGSTAKTLKIWDLAAAPPYPKVAEYVGDPASIVHNVFVKDSLAIMSYYTAGIKIVSLADPTSPVELGGYDTYAGASGGYNGAWSVYPYFPSGKIIIGDMESALYVVDIAYDAPRPASSFNASSDYATPASVYLAWNDPATLANGDPLSSFTMRLYRDGVFLADLAPGVEEYTDNGLTLHQYYSYALRTITDTDSSTLVTSAAYAGGHPQPQAPASLTLEEGTGGATLSWVTPSRQMDNTPLNDLAHIRIYRNDVLADSLSAGAADTGQVRSYTDTLSGYHTYRIQAVDNETPSNASALTDTVFGAGRLLTTYSDGFEAGIGNIYRKGTWDTVRAIAASGAACITDDPAGNYGDGKSVNFITPPVVLGEAYTLRFKHIAIIAPGDVAYLDLSTNNRRSYTTVTTYNWNAHAQWSDGNAGAGDWFEEEFNLSPYAGDTAVLRFRIQSNGSVNGEGWFIDDIYVGPANGDAGAGTFAMNNGWNMLSLPYEVSDHNRSAVFPTSVSRAFRYEGTYQGNPDTLAFGKGYWVKFDSPHSLDLAGTTLRLDTIEIVQSWNMIGSLSDPIDTADITTIPPGSVRSKYYGYEEEGYVLAATLQPGKAYWVKVSSSGQMILSAVGRPASAGAVTRPVGEMFPASQEELFHSLTVRDARGHRQTLAFGAERSEKIDLDLYELPPAPPAGAFDVRFSSQRTLALASAGEAGTYPIELHASGYPLTLSWNMSDGDGTAWTLLAGTERYPMNGRGSMLLTSPSSLALVSGEEEAAAVLPEVFSLSQNYPNPFNPGTQITFALPAASFVTLGVYNVYGQEVALLVNEERQAGEHTVAFTGSALASGVYYYRLTAAHAGGQYSATRKLTVIK